ncbi:MAG: 4Fe-4S binding protein [Acidobacteria bacterium]|nr:4Fe-4S binding protein [Acidobacteriota bacterium]MCB9398020.1 4Fe-4S binding protein [Acidobacteriota bacterium]
MLSGNPEYLKHALRTIGELDQGICEQVYISKKLIQLTANFSNARVFSNPLIALNEALGRVLSGERIAFWAAQEEVPGLAVRLGWAREHHLPFVLLAVTNDQRLALDAGFCQVHLPDHEQVGAYYAAARMVCERSLVPLIVCLDGLNSPGPSTKINTQVLQDLFKSPDLVVPTASQKLVFGARRAALPAWIDRSTALTLGLQRANADRGRRQLGQNLFFEQHLVSLAARVLAELGPQLNQRLEFTQKYQSQSDSMIVCPASWFERVVNAVQGLPHGVLGVVWQFPSGASDWDAPLRSAHKTILLGPPDGAFHNWVRDQAFFPNLIEGLVSEPTRARIQSFLAYCAHLDGGRYFLETSPMPRDARFPKQELWLQMVKREYPHLLDASVPQFEESLSDSWGSTLPHLVQDHPSYTQGLGDLAWVWGQSLQPRLEGKRVQTIPDPLGSFSLAPAFTGAFIDLSPTQPLIPEFNPERCTGCGKCWVACPESAIGVTLIEPKNLLDHLSDQVRHLHGDLKPQADKLKRQHKGLTALLHPNRFEDTGALSRRMLEQTLDAFITHSATPDAEAEAFRTVFAKSMDELDLLNCATPIRFTDPKSTGPHPVLVLAVNPATCKACSLCVDICQDQALLLNDSPSNGQQKWLTWEALPDTPGPIVEKIGKSDLDWAAPFLSRHVNQVLAGADGLPSSSIARTALRHALGMLEWLTQPLELKRIQQLNEFSRQIQDKIRQLFSAGLPIEKIDQIHRQLGATPTQKTDLLDWVQKLSEKGLTQAIDSQKVSALSALEAQVQELLDSILKANQARGRARMLCVVAAHSITRYLEFPWTSFGCPVLLDSEYGVETTLGLIQSAKAQYLTEIGQFQYLREAVSATNPLAVNPKPIEWSQLNQEQIREAPPILLVLDAHFWERTTTKTLVDLLTCDYPLRILYLDRRPFSCHPEQQQMLLTHNNLHVEFMISPLRSAAIQAWQRALQAAGPSWIQVPVFPLKQKVEVQPYALLEMAESAKLLFTLSAPAQVGPWHQRIHLLPNETSEEESWRAALHWAWFQLGCPHSETRSGPELAVWLTLPEAQRQNQIPNIQVGTDMWFQPSPSVWQAVLQRRQWTQDLFDWVTPPQPSGPDPQLIEALLAQEREKYHLALQEQAMTLRAEMADRFGDALLDWVNRNAPETVPEDWGQS